MKLFVIHCLDKIDTAQLRQATRERHLNYLREHPALRVGGPYIDSDGNMVGSMMIIEAEHADAAAAFSAGDPYTQAGLFERVDIRPFRVTVGKL